MYSIFLLLLCCCHSHDPYEQNVKLYSVFYIYFDLHFERIYIKKKSVVLLSDACCVSSFSFEFHCLMMGPRLTWQLTLDDDLITEYILACFSGLILYLFVFLSVSYFNSKLGLASHKLSSLLHLRLCSLCVCVCV